MDYDKQEFEHLFKDNYPHMYRMAFSMVENADDAKDVVHQVFTQMWRGKPKIADESVRGYLLAATRNQCLHLLRSRQLERQMVHDLRQDMVVSESEERKELLQQL
jgi:RNA polymerase sigma-70 factor (ECF subfamily)